MKNRRPAALLTGLALCTLLFPGAGQYYSERDATGSIFALAAVGTGAYLGLEHSRSNRTKFLFDFGYDATFKGVRGGGAVLFGWSTFRLKLGLSYFGAGEDAFFFPIVGLMWRFKA